MQDPKGRPGAQRDAIIADQSACAPDYAVDALQWSWRADCFRPTYVSVHDTQARRGKSLVGPSA